MPRNNWLQYMGPRNPGLQEGTHPVPPVVERIEPTEQATSTEVSPGSVITFDDYRVSWANTVDAWGYRAFAGNWSSADLQYKPAQPKGPSRESIDNWYRQGQHSRIPTCCIEWFCTRWARATKASNARYTRLLKKMHEEHKYLFQPGFIPCPKTIRAKDIVFIHRCDDRCRTAAIKASDIRTAAEILRQSVYGGQVGRVEGVRFEASDPVQEARNQREDNVHLNAPTLRRRPSDVPAPDFYNLRYSI